MLNFVTFAGVELFNFNLPAPGSDTTVLVENWYLNVTPPKSPSAPDVPDDPAVPEEPPDPDDPALPVEPDVP